MASIATASASSTFSSGESRISARRHHATAASATRPSRLQKAWPQTPLRMSSPRRPEYICAITLSSQSPKPNSSVKTTACTAIAIAAPTIAFFGAAENSTIAISASA